MGAKEKLQKELDLLLEKMRFWRYVIFGIVSGTLGIIFSASQHKIQFKIIISVKRIETLTNEYKKLLNELEKE